MTHEVLLTVLKGVPITLLLTMSALAIGMVGGVPLALARQSRNVVLSFLARTLIELFRGVPPIVWLFLIYFGFGTMLPALDAMSASIIGLGVISCGYLAEIYRGGLAAVARGQWEASSALGVPRSTTLVLIIAPQAGRASVPAVATYAIGLLKDSAVAFTIGVTEILYWATDQSRLITDALGPFLVAAAVYIVISVPCAWGARILDSSLRQRVAR